LTKNPKSLQMQAFFLCERKKSFGDCLQLVLALLVGFAQGVRFKVMWCNTKTKSPLTLGCRNSMIFAQFSVPLSGW
jgi:hypothetical protein